MLQVINDKKDEFLTFQKTLVESEKTANSLTKQVRSIQSACEADLATILPQYSESLRGIG